MASAQNASNIFHFENEIHRSDFPEDFAFGTATSAYQIEGGASEGGKGPSVWDYFTLRFPGKINNGDNGCDAVKSYDKCKEDVQTLKKMGLNAYRFSIAWSRILPGGKLCMGVNQEGIKYYSDLIDDLLANGLEPYVTLFHWDTPNSLEEEYKGWLSALIIDDFVHFAELCFWEFGDRVKYWITENEPWSYAVGGYVLGSFAPGRGATKQQQLLLADRSHPHCRVHLGHRHDNSDGCPGTEPYIVAHHLLLAHAAVVELYRTKFQPSQGGKIGITLVSEYFEPLDPNKQSDVDAAYRALDFMLGWFLEPIVKGDYPQTMKDYVGHPRLPKFSELQSNLLKGSLDFLGLNYYTTKYATYKAPTPGVVSYETDAHVDKPVERNGQLIGEQAGSSWFHVYPQGIYELLMYVKDNYESPDIYITENGYDEKNDPSKTLGQARMDPKRVQYHHDHLVKLKEAMNAGASVKGYFAWSFVDNFEWGEGYSVRFGLIYCDFKNGFTRYPKQSALWYKNFLKGVAKPSKVNKKRIAGNDGSESVKRTRK